MASMCWGVFGMEGESGVTRIKAPHSLQPSLRFPKLMQILFCFLTELASKSQCAGDLDI